MGRLSKQVLGYSHGKIGSYIFRWRNNKTVVYAAPEKYNVSQNPKAKESRAQIVPMSQFASIVNSIPELKYIWNQDSLKASSAYHKIIKFNFKAFEYNRPTKSNIITPDVFVPCPVTSTIITSDGFRIELFIKREDSFLLEDEKEITAIAVVCFYDPVRRWREYFTLNKIICMIPSFGGKTNTIFLPLSEQGKYLYYSYKMSILYFTLVTKDSNGRPSRYTTNYSAEFMHDISVQERKDYNKSHGHYVRDNIESGVKQFLKMPDKLFKKWLSGHSK